jgi:hypothetical protein
MHTRHLFSTACKEIAELEDNFNAAAVIIGIELEIFMRERWRKKETREGRDAEKV